eukprot:1161545-Pelagomonas_calceolata.AAC.11
MEHACSRLFKPHSWAPRLGITTLSVCVTIIRDLGNLFETSQVYLFSYTVTVCKAFEQCVPPSVPKLCSSGPSNSGELLRLSYKMKWQEHAYRPERLSGPGLCPADWVYVAQVFVANNRSMLPTTGLCSPGLCCQQSVYVANNRSMLPTTNLCSPGLRFHPPSQHVLGVPLHAWPALMRKWPAPLCAWPAPKRIWPAPLCTWPAPMRIEPAPTCLASPYAYLANPFVHLASPYHSMVLGQSVCSHPPGLCALGLPLAA